MSQEPEDFNAFTHWDCFGATLMLGLTPAIMNFVFNDKELVSTVLLAGIGLLVALVVWLLAFVTRWRIIGKLVNMAGLVLTLIYIGVAVYCWWPSDKADEAPAEMPALPVGMTAEE